MTEEEERNALESAITEGDNARKVLENPKIQGFLIAMRGDLLSKFNRTTATQTAERDEIWRMSRVVDKFEESLESYVDDGKIARKTLIEVFGEKVKGLF